MKRITVFTGNGAGKTTAALGHALRAAGHGYRVVFIQFMKGRKSGENNIKVPNLSFYKFGREEFVKPGSPTEEDKELARKGLELAKKFLNGDVFMLVLDEAVTAVNYQLLTLDDITGFLKLVPEGMAVILTGRNVPKGIQDAADLVTEMKKIKHPFDRGEDAVEGCEY